MVNCFSLLPSVVWFVNYFCEDFSHCFAYHTVLLHMKYIPNYPVIYSPVKICYTSIYNIYTQVSILYEILHTISCQDLPTKDKAAQPPFGPASLNSMRTLLQLDVFDTVRLYSSL